ncbi:MAG: excisionase family DNA-binding protein [Ignavibacteriota bacterium]
MKKTGFSSARKSEIDQLRQLLGKRRPGGLRGLHSVALPNKAYRSLIKLLDDLAEGKAVSITAAAQEMTTRQAADFLGVSRQFLVRLLDDNQLPFHRVGTHRPARVFSGLDFLSKATGSPAPQGDC